METLINVRIYPLARELLIGVMKKQLYCSLKKYWFQKSVLYSRHMVATLSQAVKSAGDILLNLPFFLASKKKHLETDFF